jgi:hypothetical protein
MQTNSAFRTVQIIHYALIFGIFIFGAIFLLPFQKLSFKLDFENVLLDFSMVWSILVFIFHNKMYTNELSKISLLNTAHEKWQKYFFSHLVRMSLLESTIFLNIILMTLNPNYYYTVLILINYLLIFSYNPDVSKIASEWHLTEEEIKNL